MATYSFSHYVVDGVTHLERELTIQLQGNTNVVAHFKEENEMSITITNNGAINIYVLEYIEKTTTLSSGASLTLDPDTKKLKIGDLEIDIT